MRKKLVPFTTAPRAIKYLGINLTKDAKDLYVENYSKFVKEIEEDILKNGKTFHAHGLEEQILLKCQYTQSSLHIQ